jgi:hypothetical protein
MIFEPGYLQNWYPLEQIALFKHVYFGNLFEIGTIISPKIQRKIIAPHTF